MSLLVTGSIGIDSVRTPHGDAPDVLGGSAVYFSFAASLFSPVRLVAAVGDDFPEEFRAAFRGRPIDIAGLETRAGSKTFRWKARYDGDMNTAVTLETHLNVLGERAPRVPPEFRDSRYLFLANAHPANQQAAIDQVASPRLVVCDTMNLWIDTARDALLATLRRVQGVVMNDGEARMLTSCTNLIEAGRRIVQLGPRFVIIKKGEHGSLLFDQEGVFALPGYPTTDVRDPTGAGDSFAGGFMGYLASVDRTDHAALRNAVVRGTVAASFTIEGFSLDALRQATREAVETRLQHMRNLVQFD